MRKFLWVVAVGALVLALAAPAMAVDLKFNGQWRVRFYAGPGMGFGERDGTQGGNPRGAQVRVRPIFSASDDNGNIQARLVLEIGDIEFGGGGGSHGPTFGSSTTFAGYSFGAAGQNFGMVPSGARVGQGAGGSMGTDGVNVETRHAYLDLQMPWGLPLRATLGTMYWYTPKGILVDDDVAGVRFYGASGALKYEAAWYRANSGTNNNSAVAVAAGPAGTTQVAGPLSNGVVYPQNSTQEDNNYDFYTFRVDWAAAPYWNPTFYMILGDNRVNCQNNNVINGNVTNAPTCGPGYDHAKSSYYIGLTQTGKVGIVSYDLDFVYGYADGGPTGTFGATNGVGQNVVAGYGIDGGLHFPVGPVTVNFGAAYFTGDNGAGDQEKSSGFPTISPAWQGPGGGMEMIGNGGAFDAVHYTGGAPVNIWGISTWLEYRPVKALYTKLALGYAGFAKKGGNCARSTPPYFTFMVGDNGPCWGPAYYGRPDKPLKGQSGIGTEVSLRADYDLYTGLKVQGEMGWLIPSKGDLAAEYVLQLLYNF